MSPAMANLNRHECGEIDLHYNDMWGLKLSIEAIADGSMLRRRRSLEVAKGKVAEFDVFNTAIS